MPEAETDDAPVPREETPPPCTLGPINVPILQQTLEDIPLEEPVDEAVFRNYVNSNKNSNTVKKTALVRIKT